MADLREALGMIADAIDRQNDILRQLLEKRAPRRADTLTAAARDLTEHELRAGGGAVHYAPLREMVMREIGVTASHWNSIRQTWTVALHPENPQDPWNSKKVKWISAMSSDELESWMMGVHRDKLAEDLKELGLKECLEKWSHPVSQALLKSLVGENGD